MAQSNVADAAIDGYVIDATGARIPGATVVVTAPATNQRRETSTDADGHFRFTLLRVGTYALTVSAQGFAEYRQEGITLNVGRSVRVDVTLSLAGVDDGVTVRADASMVQTTPTGSGEVLNERAVRRLPLSSRNVYNLHLIGPGVKGVPSSNAATTVFFTGGLARTTWMVDGIDATSRRFDRQIRLGVVSPEAVEEMQLLSGGQSAEFGRSAGATLNIVTRGGTNDFHGSGMTIYRPNSLAARPPLAATKTEQSWWLAAGNLGGPIVRDRVWFFVNDEYNPYREPQPVTITTANTQALGLTAEDVADSEYGETYHSPSAKVNFQLNPRNSGFVRYGRFSNAQPVGRTGLTIPARTTDYRDRQNTVALQWVSTLTPSLLSESRFSFNTRTETRRPVGSSGPDGAFINIQSVANIGVNPLAFNEGTETSTTASQTLTWTKGRHMVKAGFGYQTTRLAVTNALNRTFTFNGLAAADGRGPVTPLDQYLQTVRGDIDPATGRPYTYSQLTQQLGDSSLARRFHFLTWFAQDELRISPRFTVNVGIRHEALLYPVMDDRAPHLLSRDVQDARTNIAPRVGFSLLPVRSRRTVLRGFYGVFYDTPSLNLLINAGINNGRRVQTYVVQGSDAGAPTFPSLLAGAETSLPAVAPSVTAFSPELRTLYGHNAGIGIEHEFVRNLTVALQYSWWGHRDGLYARDINLGEPVRDLADGRPVFQGASGRPDTRFNAINLLESGAKSNYHGLDVTVRRRSTAGLQLSATWTWSHAVGDGEMQGGALSNPADRRFDRGDLNGDARHTLNLAALYAPQFQTRFLRFFNGWELSSTAFWNSGYPIDPRAGVDLNNDLVLNDRQIGVARNSVVGPRFLQVDVRVIRRVRWLDSHALELFVESDNLLNTVNANCTNACTDAVVNRQDAVDFGRITGARPGRRVQLGVRYSF